MPALHVQTEVRTQTYTYTSAFPGVRTCEMDPTCGLIAGFAMKNSPLSGFSTRYAACCSVGELNGGRKVLVVGRGRKGRLNDPIGGGKSPRLCTVRGGRMENQDTRFRHQRLSPCCLSRPRILGHHSSSSIWDWISCAETPRRPRRILTKWVRNRGPHGNISSLPRHNTRIRDPERTPRYGRPGRVGLWTYRLADRVEVERDCARHRSAAPQA